MNRNRRTALKALAAGALLGSMRASAAPVGGGPVNVVGFGSCGGRIVRRLTGGRRGVSDGDFVAVDNLGAPRGLGQVESFGATGDPHDGRPLVVVAGAGGRAGGEHAWRWAAEWSEARRTPVVPVLVLGFRWEGSYRARGLALAERFAARFGTVSLIDNQSIDERFLAHIDEISLLELWDRINAHATARIERVIAVSRNA